MSFESEKLKVQKLKRKLVEVRYKVFLLLRKINEIESLIKSEESRIRGKYFAKSQSNNKKEICECGHNRNWHIDKAGCLSSIYELYKIPEGCKCMSYRRKRNGRR